jgi:hypothetical protein
MGSCHHFQVRSVSCIIQISPQVIVSLTNNLFVVPQSSFLHLFVGGNQTKCSGSAVNQSQAALVSRSLLPRGAPFADGTKLSYLLFDATTVRLSPKGLFAALTGILSLVGWIQQRWIFTDNGFRTAWFMLVCSSSLNNTESIPSSWECQCSTQLLPQVSRGQLLAVV